VDKLKEREQAETNPEKKKQLRKDRIAAQNELKEATKKRQGLDKNVVVNEMTYTEWKNWKNTLVNSGNGCIVKVKSSVDVSFAERPMEQPTPGRLKHCLKVLTKLCNQYGTSSKANSKHLTRTIVATRRIIIREPAMSP
jgi:hypothetical protein